MDIKETFLKLTSRTYPHGTEEQLFPLLPQDLDFDTHGNLFKRIGDNPSTLFACHLDTATSALTDVKHVIEGDIIKTDGKSILGADDNAGVTIMLYMMENKIPGLYYFFLGEEVGCVGSKKLATELKDKKIEGITKVISFDRRHTTSVITHQFGTRCCSDEFGTALSKAFNDAEPTFNYKNDPTGLYTDSAQFVKIYPECTNISVGYWSEHTFGESQNIVHLEKLANACLKVDWENLPIKRDPEKVDIEKYGWGYGFGESGDDWYDDDRHVSTDYKNGYSSWSKSTPKQPEPKDETFWFKDEEYMYWSFVNVQKYTGKITKIDLCKERLEDEVKLIREILLQLEVGFSNLKWNGIDLTVNYADGHSTTCDRKELLDFLPELDFWKKLVDEDEEVTV
jgi:hypothetical protein